ncbi:hypothetical protein [Halovenus sp. HT40]|uniref:hypothetical protein n=1 Tax=Halovenus sp. HT40 TaxID=3126691 RepID=UPI00300F4DA8
MRPRSALTRRSYLALGAASVTTLSVTAAANGSTRRHGIEFDRVLNAVDDLGIDPTGGAAADEQIAQAGDGTLVQFPDGKYRFDSETATFDGGTHGFEGVGEHVSFLSSGDRPGFLLNGSEMEAAYIDGIDLDQRQSAACAGLRFSGNRIVIQNIDVHGRPDTTGGLPLLAHATLNADGVSRIRNLNATAGRSRQPMVRPGIFVEDNHKGTLTIQDCDLRRFPHGAVHADRHSGRVHVQDSHFENNALSIRLCGSGSSIQNCSILVEEFPSVEPENATEPYRFHGVSIASAAAGGSQPIEISDSEFQIEQLPASVPAIVIPSAGPALSLVESRIEYNNTGCTVVLARRPDSGSAGVRPLRVRDTTITGNGSVDSVIELENANGSKLDAVRILLDQADTDGIRICDSEDCRIEQTDIAVPGQAAILRDATVECLALSDDSSSDPAANQHSSGTDTLAIDGATAETAYEFTADGRIYAETESTGYPTSGTNSEGVVGNGTDRYTVEGTITDIRLDGVATVYLNGQQVNPAAFNGGYPHELVFNTGDTATSYTFAVTALSPWEAADGTGRVTVPPSGAADRYRFDGAVDSLSVRGTAEASFGQSDRR